MPKKNKGLKEKRKELRKKAKAREKIVPGPFRPGPLNETSSSHYARVGAWFLGSKSENADIFKTAMARVVTDHVQYRKDVHPDDPPYVEESMKQLDEYKDAVAVMNTELDICLAELKKSAALFTGRSMGHMCWDILIAANVGWFAGMMYNQNNVAAEASPYTTQVEQDVCYDLCRMFQYNVVTPEENPDAPAPNANGHLCSGGSSANIEAMWAARELKFSLLAYRLYLDDPDANPAPPESLKNLTVNVKSAGADKKLQDCTYWELLNININEILDYQDKFNDGDNGGSAEIADAVSSYTLQKRGLPYYAQKLDNINFDMRAYGSWTMHYSLEKSAWVLGFGMDFLHKVEIDLEARMSLDALRTELDYCLANKIPVIQVICIMGTTLESAIDPIADVLEMRDDYEAKGLSFAIHGDAAWGGYYMAMQNGDTPENKDDGNDIVPGLAMSDHAARHFQALKHADSITIDPHKAGYIPYACGAICFRDKRYMGQTTLSNPYINRPGEASVGVYGLQGSKPGAAALSCHLAHKVCPLDMTGYGLLHAQCTFATKIYFCMWQVMHDDDDPFVLKTGLRIPEEHEPYDAAAYEAKRQWIRENIIDIDDDYSDLGDNVEVMEYLRSIGPDLSICTFAINYKMLDGTLNTNPVNANLLNKYVFEKFSKTAPDQPDPAIIFTSTNVSDSSANIEFFKQMELRMGLTPSLEDPLYYLVNTLMSPWPTADDWPQTIEYLVREAINEWLDANANLR